MARARLWERGWRGLWLMKSSCWRFPGFMLSRSFVFIQWCFRGAFSRLPSVCSRSRDNKAESKAAVNDIRNQLRAESIQSCGTSSYQLISTTSSSFRYLHQRLRLAQSSSMGWKLSVQSPVEPGSFIMAHRFSDPERYQRGTQLKPATRHHHSLRCSFSLYYS